MPTTTVARKIGQRSCAAFLLGVVLCCMGGLNPSHAQDPPPAAPPADTSQSAPPATGENTPPAPPAETLPGAGGKGNEKPDVPKTGNAGAEAGWDLKKNWLALIIVAGIVLVVLIGTAVMLYFSRKPAQSKVISELPAAFFFWLGLCYATVLLLLAVAYHFAWTSKTPCLLAHMLPIGIPWFGALGAVTISLAGVFFYGDAKWEKNFNYWHLGRPVFGAVLGVVAFFIFVLIVSTAGTPPPFLQDGCKPDGSDCQPNDFIIYYVLAFLVGYREQTFRELISRVTDLILKPGQAGSDAPAIAFNDAQGAVITTLDFPNVAINVPGIKKIKVVNTGKGALKEATLTVNHAGGGAQPVFTATNPFAANKELPAGQSVEVDVTFTPTVAATTYAATLSVAGKDFSPVTLSLTGTCP